MKNIICLILFCGLISNGCATAKSVTTNNSAICSQLNKDLNYIYNSTKENLSVYQYDQELKRRVDSIYQEEIQRAQSCQSESDYVKGIRRYFASFHDPHLQPLWQVKDSYRGLITNSIGAEIKPTPVKLQYFATGILIKKIGAGYFVTTIDDKMLSASHLKTGDELVECDGQSVDKILDQEILPYEAVSVHEAGLYNHANKLFFRWDKVQGSTSLCQFRRGNDHFETTLQWQNVDPGYLSQFSQVTSPIYSIEKTSYGHWVKLRSLAGYSEKETAQLKQFVQDAKSLQKDRIIVLDLRGNSGGISSWGDDWIKNLYGYAPKSSSKTNLIFSSPGNIGHYQRIFELFDKNNGFASQSDKNDLQLVIKMMQQSPNQLIELPKDSQANDQKTKNKSLFDGKLYVVSDADVFSSGELFLQMLRLMPRVTQVGLTTNASTEAGDIRFDQTPNGLIFTLATKVFRSIFVGRNPGEPLVPQIRIEPDPSNEFLGQDSMRSKIEKLFLHNTPKGNAN